ncbi:MAG: exonuclease, partial [Frankiales bacterium]|nr:exonuclease [Frankiales bacterium]
MRPHRLRVTAFGPFAETVEVDLDALAGSGLFLLQGDTGSGKTTLLDALGFALYGRVPGVRNKAGRLRSDHAPADLRTSVQLEVTLAGRRLRLTRSPAQERPKARGTGTTTEPAKVLLEERDASGTWRGVSTRAGEADQEVKDLVGMSADQFFQVVLLPQGDFARFLRAEADERGKLLQALFGTERFSRVESWLAEQRRTASAAAAAAGEAVRQAAALVRQAAGVPLDDAPLPLEEALS